MRARFLWASLLPFLAVACGHIRAVPPAPVPAPAAERVRQGDVLRRRGRLQEAEAIYREALQRDSTDVRAHVGLQRIGLERGQDLQLRHLYRIHPNSYLAGRLEGREDLQRKAFEAAPEPWRSLGLAYLAEIGGDPKRAARLLEGVLATDPGNVWARLRLGRVLLNTGRAGEAADQFEAALWTDPEHPGPAAGVSLVEESRGRQDAALRWAQAAQRRAPAEPVLVARVHQLAANTGEPARLRAAAHGLLRTEGPSGVAVLYAADMLQNAGAAAAAERAFARAVEGGITVEEVASWRHVPPADEGFERFVSGLRRGAVARYRHFRSTGEMETFAQFHAWVRRLYEKQCGEVLGPAGEPSSYAFIGLTLDATGTSRVPIVRACARRGFFILLGQRRGGPPELFFGRIARRDHRRAATVRGVQVEREVIWVQRRIISGYAEWAGGGETAGLALDGQILIDLQAVAAWEGEWRRALRRMQPVRQSVLAAEALRDQPVTSIEDPAGISWRLLLDSHRDLREEILAHENAHLVDAQRHLPVEKHLFRNLALAVGKGFDAKRILAFLERNAQVTAIAEGPTPRAGLAVCCSMLTGSGAHSLGYEEIVQGMVDDIEKHPDRYPTIDTQRVIVQQLHRLSERQVRAAARQLMVRWGLVAPPQKSG